MTHMLMRLCDDHDMAAETFQQGDVLGGCLGSPGFSANRFFCRRTWCDLCFGGWCHQSLVLILVAGQVLVWSPVDPGVIRPVLHNLILLLLLNLASPLSPLRLLLLPPPNLLGLCPCGGYCLPPPQPPSRRPPSMTSLPSPQSPHMPTLPSAISSSSSSNVTSREFSCVTLMLAINAAIMDVLT